jgi:PAS domain S-box-containing protein
MEALAGAIAGSRPDRNDGVIDQPHQDGTLRHVEITTTVVRDAGGTPVEVVGVSRDATERVRSERRLAGSETLLRAIADSSPDAIFAKDLAGRWTFANVAAIRQLMANDRRVIDEGAPITFAETVLTPEGSRKFLTSKAPLRDPEGRIIGVVETARDVSALETATEELRRSRQRVALAMEGSTDGFWDIDVAPRRVFLSARYRQLSGWPAMEGEVGIEEMMALIEPDFLPGIQASISDLRSGALDRFSWEYQTRGADGSLRWLQSRGKVVERRPDGAPTRISGTISDIHERKVAEEALRASEGRLRLIARSFPQGSIALFDEEDRALLVDGKTIFLGLAPEAYLGKKPHDFAPPEFAGQIVRDLITTGHPSPDRTRVRIRDVVAEAVLRMPAPLRERFMVRVVDQGAPDVLAAAGQLSQAIANLLDNAAEALPADGGQDIVVRIGRTATNGACVEVEDPGSGIPPDVLGRVFDPFFTTRPIGQGIGLGLSVAHAIVTAHGGTISATSTPGKGSTFRIELSAAS